MKDELLHQETKKPGCLWPPGALQLSPCLAVAAAADGLIAAAVSIMLILEFLLL